MADSSKMPKKKFRRAAPRDDVGSGQDAAPPKRPPVRPAATKGGTEALDFDQITRSHQESLFTYMRALDTRGEGLSRKFVTDLKAALRHYGVKSLKPSRKLKEALLWIGKSHSRVDQQVPAVISILERRLDAIESLASTRDVNFRNLLDRLVSASLGRG